MQRSGQVPPHCPNLLLLTQHSRVFFQRSMLGKASLFNQQFGSHGCRFCNANCRRVGEYIATRFCHNLMLNVPSRRKSGLIARFILAPDWLSTVFLIFVHSYPIKK
mmetsp:Transcript_32153/g.40307  ORF Transcript_32153/g.40307 Transcript_32153/m.40307 type:complete len:106 (+) Transcript_32153:3361-3678(+)